MSKAPAAMKPITYSSEHPQDWAAALSKADNLKTLRRVCEDWGVLCPDALAIATKMTTGDFEEFKIGLRKERHGAFAGDAFSEKYSALMMPEILFRVSIVATKYIVPWGTAYIRLRDSGQLDAITSRGSS